MEECISSFQGCTERQVDADSLSFGREKVWPCCVLLSTHLLLLSLKRSGRAHHGHPKTQGVSFLDSLHRHKVCTCAFAVQVIHAPLLCFKFYTLSWTVLPLSFGHWWALTVLNGAGGRSCWRTEAFSSSRRRFPSLRFQVYEETTFLAFLRFKSNSSTASNKEP